MNYGPYMGMPYYNMASTTSRSGIFSRLLGGVNFGNILNTTQKTLNIINQAIPVIKQAQPVIKNAKTMFKVMNEFKRDDVPAKTNQTIENKNIINTSNENNIKPDKFSKEGPTFFI